MGLPKQLSEQQMLFAKFLVYNKDNKTPTQCAIEAGYAESSAHVRASELRNKQKFPLVYDYINELRDDLFSEISKELLNNAAVIMEAGRKSVSENGKIINKKDFKRFHDFAKTLIPNTIRTVYLAVENRLDGKTPYYKIGVTDISVAHRAQSNTTDNPFHLNYIASFKYLTEGYNIESYLHSNLRKKNAYEQNKGGTEWFDLSEYRKKRTEEELIEIFYKVCTRFCKKYKLQHMADTKDVFFRSRIGFSGGGMTWKQ